MVASINVSSDLDRVTARLSREAQRQVPFATALALTRTGKAVEKDLRSEIARVFDRPTPFISRGTFSTSAKKTDLRAFVGMRDQSRRGGASPARYLAEHFTGGVRGEKAFERALRAVGALPDGWRAMPGGALKLDSYGNPARRDIREILKGLKTTGGVARHTGSGKGAKNVGYFVVLPGAKSPRTQHLSPGIWKRITSSGRAVGPGRGSAHRAGNVVGRSVVMPVFIFTRRASYRPRLNLPRIARAGVERVFRTEFNRALDQALRSAR